MKAFTLQEAAAALGLPQMQAQATLADVCTDTRKIQPGSLFVCLRGNGLTAIPLHLRRKS